MKKTNNKGFSLVELIIVIAIMAVLVGILAPQFIQYVDKSRRSTDIKNAQEIATAIQVDVADGNITADVTNGDFDGTITEGIATTPTPQTTGYTGFLYSVDVSTGEVTVTIEAAAGGTNYVLYPNVAAGFNP
jgi:prepilin-type N-terminal cleavage/methylation domain-containing protein